MGKHNTKPIQTDLGTFRHNQTFPGNIQAYSGIFRTLCYPDIFKTVVYVLEAATGGVLFLEISLKLQENTCARVSFLIKLQA